MMKNHIKEALILNRIYLEDSQGLKIYYSKLISGISLLMIFSILSLGSFVIGNESSQSRVSFTYLLIFGFLIYFIPKNLGRFLMKNPIFILENDKLFYLKTNEWYHIPEYRFEENSTGRDNHFLTFQMFDKNSNLIFSEKNYYFKYNRWKLKKEIKRIKKID